MFHFPDQVIVIPKDPETLLNSLSRASGLGFMTYWETDCSLDEGVLNELRIVRMQHNLFDFQVTIIL